MTDISLIVLRVFGTIFLALATIVLLRVEKLIRIKAESEELDLKESIIRSNFEDAEANSSIEDEILTFGVEE